MKDCDRLEVRESGKYARLDIRNNELCLKVATIFSTPSIMEAVLQWCEQGLWLVMSSKWRGCSHDFLQVGRSDWSSRRPELRPDCFGASHLRPRTRLFCSTGHSRFLRRDGGRSWARRRFGCVLFRGNLERTSQGNSFLLPCVRGRRAHRKLVERLSLVFHDSTSFILE